MPLASDTTVSKLQEDRRVIAHLTIRREVLDLHCGNADPVHLHRNPVPDAENVRDGVGL
jgi:hypothetical protein